MVTNHTSFAENRSKLHFPPPLLTNASFSLCSPHQTLQGGQGLNLSLLPAATACPHRHASQPHHRAAQSSTPPLPCRAHHRPAASLTTWDSQASGPDFKTWLSAESWSPTEALNQKEKSSYCCMDCSTILFLQTGMPRSARKHRGKACSLYIPYIFL